MQHVNLDEARENLSVLIEAALMGEEVVITKDGQTAVRLTPVSQPKPQFGSAKGIVTFADDFDAPLEDFEPYTK
ncbi:MAG: type II toxin-antitoxin system prevent-host-death family antitoxin [Pyrinomonadaceae bacterium MAG19_C2-C3]|nr:type II toxin-antitoxin system prevent-host-death family antitoxin [Pyrinomonadaceae bacterium MAG19_C2-C3]